MIVGRLKHSILAGIGGALGIFLLAAFSQWGGAALLMAPFGASCVLLFSVPASPLSQPLNVVGGHLVSSLIGVLMVLVAATSPLSLALAVAMAIGLMALLNVTHPPAGADPIVIMLGAKGFSFLLFPVLTGSIALVISACLFHQMLGTAQYPLTQRNQI